MNKAMIGLTMAGAAACLLPQGGMANETEAEEICRNVVANKGYQGYHFKYVETMAARSGGYSVNGQIDKGGKRFEFGCVLDDGLILKDIAIHPLGGGGSGGGHAGVPAEAQVACAEEADRYWRLKSGTSVPHGGKSTGGGMYEVKVKGGKHSGTCTVTAQGDVRGIMND